MASQNDDSKTEVNRPHLVMRLELMSKSAFEVDRICSEIVSEMKRMGAPYGGPIPMAKKKVKGPDGSYIIHSRMMELDSAGKVALWLKTFSPPDTVVVRCTMVEKMGN